MAGIFDRGKTMHCASVAVLVLCTVRCAEGFGRQGPSEPRQLAAIPSAGRLDYEVIREGEKIGAHSVMFRHEGRHLAIATRTDIAIEPLGITLYRFHYEAEEDWVDGRLTRLTSRTDDDGERLTVNLARAGGQSVAPAMVSSSTCRWICFRSVCGIRTLSVVRYPRPIQLRGAERTSHRRWNRADLRRSAKRGGPPLRRNR